MVDQLPSFDDQVLLLGKILCWREQPWISMESLLSEWLVVHRESAPVWVTLSYIYSWEARGFLYTRRTLSGDFYLRANDVFLRSYGLVSLSRQACAQLL